MIIPWKDNPPVWEEMYQSNHITTLEQLGFPNIKEVKIEEVKPPAILESLEKKVEEFWHHFTAQHPARNEPEYGLRGLEDVRADNSTLSVRVFPTNYAMVRFKNSRNWKFDDVLSAEQRDFLDNHFLTLGVAALIHSPYGYLMGRRAGPGARSGLLEQVPGGLVNPDKDGKYPDIITAALVRELREETNLDLYTDVNYEREGEKFTHINLGPKYGDFGFFCRLEIFPEAIKNLKFNPIEHTVLEWNNRETILRLMMEKKYEFNPVTIALLERLEI